MADYQDLFREQLRELLEPEGYAVLTAASGEEGLRVAADGTTRDCAWRAAPRVTARKNRALTGSCRSGWLKKVASCSVTVTGTGDRHGRV